MPVATDAPRGVPRRRFLKQASATGAGLAASALSAGGCSARDSLRQAPAMTDKSSASPSGSPSGSPSAATVPSAAGAPSAAAPSPVTASTSAVDLTATEVVAAIRSRRLGAEACVSALLARARALKDLNTWITLNEAGALAAARAIDAKVVAGQALPPLAGLPVIIKDNINSAGLATTAGTPALRDFIPADNAPALQALIDAGAIVLAKANLHELAFGITSTNFSPFAGFARNPYDRGRIPGGSSGGTAAAIAARIVPAGLGTDTGGSCRVPAALTGTAGLRPSVGNGGAERRYDSSGVVPISATRDTVGPMGRTVADIALLDSVLAGRPLAGPLSLKGLRLGVPAVFWTGLDDRVAGVMATARQRLVAAGVVLVAVDLDDIHQLNEAVSFPVALHEPRSAIPAWIAASGARGITLAGIADQVASPDVRKAFGAVMADALGKAYPDAIRVHRPRLQRRYADAFRQQAIEAIVFPTTPLPAVPIDGVAGSSTVSINGAAPIDEFGAFIRHTDPGSNAGIPGLSLPAGLTSDGLPVGLALDGPLGSDERLIGIGLAIEAVLGTLPAPRLS